MIEKARFDKLGKIAWEEYTPLVTEPIHDLVQAEDPRMLAILAAEGVAKPEESFCKACLPLIREYAALGPDERLKWELRAHSEVHPSVQRDRSRNLDPVPATFVTEYARCQDYCAYVLWLRKAHKREQPAKASEFPNMWVYVMKTQRRRDSQNARRSRNKAKPT